VYHLPDVEVYHLGGQSMKDLNLKTQVETWRSRYLFLQKTLQLSALGSLGLFILGGLQNAYQFLVYTLLNLLTVFTVRRLRRRWFMFTYLLAWHLRGRPVSMGIPR
jgi:GT2 family glycosyltransferase